MTSKEDPVSLSMRSALRQDGADEPRTRPLPAGESDIDGHTILALAGGYAADKKAVDLVALDLRGVSGYTDYFLICSGNSDRQAKAIHDAINEGLKRDHGLLPRRVEGLAESRWVLLDYLDVVIHVFTPETRDFYRLEQLWGEVPRIELDEDGQPIAEAE